VDPVTHTLFGGALAASGLKRRTRLATATLLIGANLPDVDVFAYAAGSTAALAFRRGITHGLAAVVLWPFLLAGLMLAVDRGVLRRLGRPSWEPARPGPLFLLGALAVASHPVLDFLNVYGMRWLMPFSDAWTYGDTLFIVDPWVWLVLAAAVVVPRRRMGAEGRWVTGEWRARLALGLVAGYIGLMVVGGVIARRVAMAGFAAAGAGPVTGLMAAPVPITPFRREIVAEIGNEYRFGIVSLLPRPRFVVEPFAVRRLSDEEASDAARGDPEVRAFLVWARFPYAFGEPGGEAPWVLGDARYTLDPEQSWAGVIVDGR
jgi:inner membrane protein